ncbi:hypothetical protein EDD37DRAFT_410403 [Exophiala viscosa]|uniref:uncharacterized protein n=1 Tax=Exophiala viscosa TaxID=2486360 RepID=UPI00219534ED|nr:hypothetical protein EDD37DRAFT_410403 [Exophiala viscosa]
MLVVLHPSSPTAVVDCFPTLIVSIGGGLHASVAVCTLLPFVLVWAFTALHTTRSAPLRISSTLGATLHCVYNMHTAMNAPQRCAVELIHIFLASNGFLLARLTSQLSSLSSTRQIGNSFLGKTLDNRNKHTQDTSRSSTSTTNSILQGTHCRRARLQLDSETSSSSSNTSIPQTYRLRMSLHVTLATSMATELLSVPLFSNFSITVSSTGLSIFSAALTPSSNASMQSLDVPATVSVSVWVPDSPAPTSMNTSTALPPLATSTVNINITATTTVWFTETVPASLAPSASATSMVTVSVLPLPATSTVNTSSISSAATLSSPAITTSPGSTVSTTSSTSAIISASAQPLPISLARSPAWKIVKIVSSVLGVCMLVMFAALVWLLVQRRKDRKDRSTNSYTVGSVSTSPSTVSTLPNLRVTRAPVLPPLSARRMRPRERTASPASPDIRMSIISDPRSSRSTRTEPFPEFVESPERRRSVFASFERFTAWWTGVGGEGVVDEYHSSGSDESM